MKEKEMFLIIDGHNLLFQMFFGMPARIVNQDGKAIQGILGFVGALIKIIKQVGPQYLVVLFDGQHGNERTEILPEYKENRIDYSLVSEEENPFSQLQDIYNALDFMGIKFYEVDEGETDDVIAGYAYKYGQNLDVTISSWDSDFFQLISEKVKVLRYRGEKTIICDKEYIENKFMVQPALYADFKALTGDKADNIKGAEKVGIKTASKLIHQFGGLDAIIANADKIEKKSVRESVVRDKERLLKNYEIIKLSDKAKVPFDIGELQYTYNDLKTNDVLCGIGVK